MNEEFKNDLTEEEKRILNLNADKSFREEISNLQNKSLNLEERTKKIRKILSEKNIEYTEDDVKLFNDIINYVVKEKSELSPAELEHISAGAKSDYPPDFPEDLMKKMEAAKRKTKLVAWAILGATFAAGSAFGFGLGYFIRGRD